MRSIFIFVFILTCAASYFGQSTSRPKYPEIWFTPIIDPNKPDWEILPQEAKPGEVILSKRNELGILSNFAATPFVFDGKRYSSVEGFWQMMHYPEGPHDLRAKDNRLTWKYTREEVAQMTAFEAKCAGTLAEANEKILGIDWVSYKGKRFSYRSQMPGEHYKLILAAMLPSSTKILKSNASCSRPAISNSAPTTSKNQTHHPSGITTSSGCSYDRNCRTKINRRSPQTRETPSFVSAFMCG